MKLGALRAYSKYLSKQNYILYNPPADIKLSKADIEKNGSWHLFRHNMASLTLKNRVDIWYIQKMLGHAKIDTTQIYTQISIRRLKEVHDLNHPAKSLKDDELEEEFSPCVWFMVLF